MQTSRFPFRVLPLALSVLTTARQAAKEGRSDHRYVQADGSDGFPCRCCLRLARRDEQLILFPFRAIEEDIPYAESGPVFIHAHACTALPVEDEFPPEFREKNLVFRAYNEAREIIDAQVAGHGRQEEVISDLLANPAAAFLHARNVGYGCYMMRIERS